MYECWKRLLHANWRTAATNIACQRQQFLHGNKIATLVASSFCRQLKVNFLVAWNYAYKISVAITLQDQSLENSFDRFAKLSSDVYCTQVVFVDLVWNKLVCNLFAVEQTGSVGLL